MVCILSFYASFLSPFAVVALAAYTEWNMWTDPREESFKHIGQWGSLVAVGLVFAAAIVDQLVSKFKDD
jgi:hypothetical protein